MNFLNPKNFALIWPREIFCWTPEAGKNSIFKRIEFAWVFERIKTLVIRGLTCLFSNVFCRIITFIDSDAKNLNFIIFFKILIMYIIYDKSMKRFKLGSPEQGIHLVTTKFSVICSINVKWNWSTAYFKSQSM